MTQTPPFALVPEGPTLIAIHELASYDELGSPVIGPKIGDLINLQDTGPDGEDVCSPEWRIDSLDGTDVVEIGDFTRLGEAVAELREHIRATTATASTATPTETAAETAKDSVAPVS